MKLATTTGDFSAYANSQQECMDYIHQAGFRFIDYSFGMDYNRGNGVYSADWQAYLDDVLRTADRLGVSFVQAHSPMGSPIRRGDYHTEFVDATKRCIDSCAKLGIRNLVVHSGYEQGISKAECLERNRDFFMELLTYSEPMGVNILVENFNKMCVEGMYWIDNAPDLKEMIDLVDHPLFHAVWDTGHANMQEMPQDEALRLAKDALYEQFGVTAKALDAMELYLECTMNYEREGDPVKMWFFWFQRGVDSYQIELRAGDGVIERINYFDDSMGNG